MPDVSDTSEYMERAREIANAFMGNNWVPGGLIHDAATTYAVNHARDQLAYDIAAFAAQVARETVERCELLTLRQRDLFNSVGRVETGNEFNNLAGMLRALLHEDKPHD